MSGFTVEVDRNPWLAPDATRVDALVTVCHKFGIIVIAEGIEERKRLVSVGKETMTLVKEYIEKRENPDGRLINLTRQSVYYIVRNAAEKAGLAGKTIMNPETGKLHYVHPHNFRDSLAVAWLDLAGSDAGKQKALQDHLGHKRFETTMRYHKLTPTDVQEVGDEVRKKRFKERHG